MKLPRLVFAFLSICLFLDQICIGASVSAQEERRKDPATVKPSTNAVMEIDSPLSLRRLDDGSVCGAVKLSFYLDAPWSQSFRILRIDNVCTKGRSIGYLQNLLRGKPGTLKTLDVVSYETGEISTVGMPVKEISPTFRELTPSYETISSFYRIHSGASTKSAAKQAADFDVIPMAIATYRHILNGRPGVLRKTSDSEITLTLPDALKLFDSSGSFDDSEAAIKFAIRMSANSLSELPPPDINALAEIATYLAQTGRVDSSREIWKNLIDTADGARLSEQLLLRSAYGSFLLDSSNEAEARAQFEKIETLIGRPLVGDDFLSLQPLLDYYEHEKAVDKAKILVRQMLQQQKDLESPNVAAHYIRYQKSVRLLLQLARISTAAGEYDEAKQSLEQALTYAQKYSTAEQQITLERLNSNSCSDVEIELARVLLLQKQGRAALEVLQDAARRIEKALGSDSPTLKEVFVVMAEVRQHVGDESLAASLSDKARRIAAPVLDGSIDQSDDWLKYLRVYELIRKNKFLEAERTTDELIAKSCEHGGFSNALELSRAICLATKYKSSSHNSIAKKLLSKLNTQSSSKTDAVRSWLLAELYCTLLAESPGANETSETKDVWKSLEDNERRLFFYRYPSAALNTIAPEELQGRYTAQLRGVADLLRVLGQPEEAEVMFKKLDQGNTTCRGLLLALIEQDKYDEFDKFALRISETNFDWLVPASLFLRRKGQIRRAKACVRQIEGFQSRSGLVSQAELAACKVAVGEFQEAVELFETSGGYASDYPLLFAYALREHKMYDRAILKFLEDAMTERSRVKGDPEGATAGFSSVRWALALMEARERVEFPAVAALREFLHDLPTKNESVALSDQIVSVAKKFKSSVNPPEVVEACKRILERENSQDSSEPSSTPVQNQEAAEHKSLSRSARLSIEANQATLLLKQGKDAESMKLVMEVLTQLSRDPRLCDPPSTPPARLWDSLRIYRSRGVLEVLVQTSELLIRRQQLKDFNPLVELLEQCLVRCCGPKNPLLGRTHEMAATVAGAANDKEKRRHELGKAFEIAAWAWGSSSRRNMNLRASYISALRD